MSNEHAARPRPERLERKLAAILHADVQGYSRLLGEDEATTLRTVASHLSLMRSLVEQHGGRAVGSRGDSLLAEFPSVVDAVQCAVEMQQALKERNKEVPLDRRVEFRIGINLGEVVVEGEEIYGEGVNIAVRLEGLAEAGGICISEVVYQQLKNKLALTYEDFGQQTLKNIAEPVRVYRVAEPGSAPPLTRTAHTKHPTYKQRAVLVAVLVLVVGIAGGVLLYLFRSPAAPVSVSSDKAAALPLPDKPSIVVLPFVNMSKDPEQEYFSDGLTDVLTGDLSKISSLFVIARNSAFTYKGKAVKVQDVGREMGVRYVLEGSVQKAGEQVRIVTQLIDTTTDAHVWAERYDRPLTDLFALQDEIVRQIVTTLKLQLTLEERGITARKHTDNLEAYDAFLRGQEYHSRFTKEATAQARQMYEQALVLDPQYAEAAAFLCWTYLAEWVFHWSADPQNLERALALAQKAIALDDSLPVAHSLLSWIYAEQHQTDLALAEGERAIALDPNNADSYALQAQALSFAGRPEDVLRLMAQALRFNPRYPPWYLFEVGWAYRMTGRYAEAIATLKDLLSRDPNFLPAFSNLAISYLWQWLVQQSSSTTQPWEPAVAAAQRTVALNEAYHWGHLTLGYISLYQQQYDLALAEMERAIALVPTEAGSYAALAEVLSDMGRTEDAVEAANQALRLKPEIVDDHLGAVGTAYTVAGRYEEARVPLQRYLSRYPNILPYHLMLAAVYSELGQDAEARAEAAEVLRLNPQFSLEVHRQRMPIKDPAVLERHIAALRKAGLQ
jgi:adenylate cyclase